MTIGDDQGAECSETLKGLITMLLRGRLVDGCIGSLSIAAGDLLGLPDEVLEEVTLVLGKQQNLGLLNDLL